MLTSLNAFFLLQVKDDIFFKITYEHIYLLELNTKFMQFNNLIYFSNEKNFTIVFGY